MRKSLFGVILLIILICLIGIIWFFSLRVNIPPPQTQKLPLKEKQAVLSLFCERKEFKLGEKIEIQVMVDSGGYKTNGVDVVLNFDPQYLKFEKLDYSESLFKTFPPYLVEKEKIRFSALSLPQESFEGKGKVATLFFKTLKKGETKISFDFQPHSTTDSNIALYGKGKDVLQKVNNLSISIK